MEDDTDKHQSVCVFYISSSSLLKQANKFDYTNNETTGYI